MGQRIQITIITFILILSSFVFIFHFESSDMNVEAATTRYVGGTGPGNWSKIQDAIDNTSAGDTIRVFAGTYYEKLSVYKTITLIGNGTEDTIIDGGVTAGNVVEIVSDWVNVSGFTITGCGSLMGINAGIKLTNVQNCKIFNNNVSSNNWAGIHLISSSNNLLTNNTCTNNPIHGILISDSSNNIISNNSCNSNYHGIYLSLSPSNMLINNTFLNNSFDSISISYSSNIVIINNTMVSKGIILDGRNLEWWNTHIINNNTINGKPICYLKNLSGSTIPSNQGQLILANCTNIIIENHDFSNGSCGIELGHSNNNTLQNNTCSLNTWHGIYQTMSSNNKIINNTCSKNSWDGISISRSTSNILINNTCSNNFKNGIHLDEIQNSNLLNNTCISNNLSGIWVDSSINNELMNNTCISNNISGIHLYYSNSNILKNNTCSLNNLSGIFIVSYSSSNTFINNICYMNNLNGIYLKGTHLDNKFVNNTCMNNTNGIYLNGFYNTCNSNTFLNNICRWNNDFGIILYGWYGTCNKNTIMNNICLNNNYGIYLNGSYGSCDSNIIKNNICSNNKHGIELNFSSNNNELMNNTCSNNNVGISFNHSSINNLLTMSNITNNNQGIVFQQSSNATINNCSISNNTICGINNTDPSILINATYNWWGNVSGPYDPSDDRTTGGWYNPNGTGDNVSDYVMYKPWLGFLNLPPVIENSDITAATEDTYYEVVYSASDPNWDNIVWTYASNASWLGWGISNQTLYGNPRNDDVGSYWVCINVSDEFGGFDENNFTINVLNLPPEILTTDITTATEDQLYNNDYNSDDDGQGNITWNLNTNGSWLNLDKDTGELSGTPTNADVGSYWVNITINDGNGGLDSTNFTLTVINVNDAPVILTSDVTSVNEEQYYEVVYSAIDVDIGNLITWSYSSNATWLKWGSNNHTIYGTPQNADVGSYWVRINISDGNGGYDEHYFILTVVNTNDRPTIDTTDVTIANEDEYYEVVYTATEIDVGDILTWTFDSNANDWLNWNSALHTLYGTPENEHVSSYWVRINISDGNGGYDEHYFILIVVNTNDRPIIDTTDITSAYEDKYYEVVYTATDIDVSDTLTWTFDSNAAWLNWGSTNHMLFGTPRNEYVGEYWVKINISDGAGGYDEHYFVLSVINTNDPPRIKTQDVITAIEDKHYSVAYSAVDIDIGDTLEWTFQSNANWLSWGIVNHTIYGIPKNDDFGEYRVKINVSDGNGGYDEHYFTLTVTNTNDPPGPAEIIKPEDGTKITKGEPLDFEGTCDDPDLVYGDELTFRWYSNILGKLGEGKNLEDITLDVGEHEIKLEVSDKIGETAIAIIHVSVSKIPVIPGDDADGDNLPDAWESAHGLNPSNPADATSDPDQDGLTNFEEYNEGTDPQEFDTDKDGLSDGDEVKKLKTNATNPDTDGDSYNDDVDKYPLDSANWKEKTPGKAQEDDSTVIVMIIVVVILAIIFVLLLLMLFFKGKPPKIREQKPEQHIEFKRY